MTTSILPSNTLTIKLNEQFSTYLYVSTRHPGRLQNLKFGVMGLNPVSQASSLFNPMDRTFFIYTNMIYLESFRANYRTQHKTK
jgi:hypothetical protein